MINKGNNMKRINNLKSKFNNIFEEIKKLEKNKRNIIAFSMILVMLIGAIGFGKTVASSINSKVGSPDSDNNIAYAIVVNEKEIVNVASKNDAEAVLNQVKYNYLTPGSEVKSADFVENVVITPSSIDVDRNEIITTSEAITLIITGSKEPKTYVVQGGDTVWDIALNNNISPYELMEMNPGVENKISIGQTLNLYQVNPYVTVKTDEVIASTEKIEYGIQYEYTTSLYKGQSQVKAAGSYGSKDMTAEVVKENGIIVQTTLISETITAKPIIQTNLVGTKTIPIKTGSGQFGIPVTNLEISSPFGANRGGVRHLGVDLRMPKGSLIMAADGGTAILASYEGSYGNLIIINHGNGFETYYGHCNSMNVSVGDQVTKGQVIGTVGATGNATGNHLHFEVRINGVPVNPLNYL
jgi:murein DD-endopeptidase MepM/ murein hydrolase activator NlpD